MGQRSAKVSCDLAERKGPVEESKKVVIIGGNCTGKTRLMYKYVNGTFDSSHVPTVGNNIATKTIPQQDKVVTLRIYDVGAQERLGQMTHVYFQNAVGALVVCDIARPKSFDAAIKWKQDLDSKVFFGKTGNPLPALLLVNKCDLGKLHKTAEEMDALCTEHGFIGGYETSAKEDINVSTAFLRLVDEVQRLEEASFSGCIRKTAEENNAEKQTSVPRERATAPAQSSSIVSCCCNELQAAGDDSG